MKAHKPQLKFFFEIKSPALEKTETENKFTDKEPKIIIILLCVSVSWMSR
jgi:hypothetical protein